MQRQMGVSAFNTMTISIRVQTDSSHKFPTGIPKVTLKLAKQHAKVQLGKR